MNLPALTINAAMATVRSENTPEGNMVLSYLDDIRSKNVVTLGSDEAFVLTDGTGEIRAFKQNLTLSAENGGLIQPVYKGPHVISAQGYEKWAEATGASVIFPKEVLVGREWMPNPYAERDPENRRILAVHARAVAFKFSSKGIPQVSDWTTIFDTPSYRLIDLLAKAKKLPQAFRLLPTGMDPEAIKGQKCTWAKYPFDESTSLWVNTSHDEALSWYAQILNREKKSMDFAQTFAKRNALKHLSGLQKAPAANWDIPVLCWRPTSGSIVKWDGTQYAQLQQKVGGMISGDNSMFEENGVPVQIEAKQGKENVSDEQGYKETEAATDPEDQADVIDVQGGATSPVPPPKEPVKTVPSEPKPVPMDKKPVLSKDQKQAEATKKIFPAEYEAACKKLGLSLHPENLMPEEAVEVVNRVNSILDMQAGER